MKEGKFEIADKGTLFLDEVADMSLTLQAKLLRVLQEGTFERIGSNKVTKVNVRVISATNKNLENAIASKTFREDLYYRLKVITITLPPLRMHAEDIPLLTNYFLSRHCNEMKKPLVTVPPETMEGLLKYSWPGNVRELENLLKRALLLSKSNVITPDLISAEINSSSAILPGTSEKNQSGLLPDNLDEYEGKLFKHVIEKVEKELIEKTLEAMKGNQVRTAKMLGISRAMLHERMERFGLL
jgi:DNA-binding NtrC family response regulator